MALDFDYCEVCGNDQVENLKIVTGTHTVWVGRGVICGHEVEICVKPNEIPEEVQEPQQV